MSNDCYIVLASNIRGKNLTVFLSDIITKTENGAVKQADILLDEADFCISRVKQIHTDRVNTLSQAAW